MNPAELMELGLKLFPVTEKKRPAMVGWQKYATNATIWDIRNDWRKGYRAFGIYLAPTRLVVFDSDNEQANAWAEQHLPDTPMMTMTKRGMHRYYRLPEGAPLPTDNRPHPGVAIDRKAKGYVIAPGSSIGGFVYTERSFWDTPLDELPLYPVGMFPERIRIKCDIDVPRVGLTPLARVIAQWFVDNCEDSVQGENGSRHLKRAASFYINGLNLEIGEAMALLMDWNDKRAFPKWGEGEMLHALETSMAEGTINGRPRGWAYTDWGKR